MQFLMELKLVLVKAVFKINNTCGIYYMQRAKQLAEADEKQSKKETAAVRAKRRQKRKEDLEGEDLASKYILFV